MQPRRHDALMSGSVADVRDPQHFVHALTFHEKQTTSSASVMQSDNEKHLVMK